MKPKFFFILIMGLTTNLIFAQTLDVTIKNVRSKKGFLRIGIFKSQKEFSSEKTVYDFKFEKADLKDGTMKVELPIVPGTYGLSVIDDTNKDGKMEYHIFGIPKEGFGFSNFILKKLIKPKFSDFSFDAEKNKTIPIEVTLKYL